MRGRCRAEPRSALDQRCWSQQVRGRMAFGRGRAPLGPHCATTLPQCVADSLNHQVGKCKRSIRQPDRSGQQQLDTAAQAIGTIPRRNPRPLVQWAIIPVCFSPWFLKSTLPARGDLFSYGMKGLRFIPVRTNRTPFHLNFAVASHAGWARGPPAR